MKVAVIGLGESGYWAAYLAASVGFSVSVFDDIATGRVAERARQLKSACPSVNLFLGMDLSRLDVDLVVKSPGVPWNHPVVERAVALGKEVVDEVEFAYRFIPLEVAKKALVITGTNGKTTTTAMVSHVLKKAGYLVFTGGNYGVPLARYVLQREPADFIVLELSSFQIEGLSRFTARGGVLLNVAQDHVDRHGSFEEYLRIKLRLAHHVLEFFYVNCRSSLLASSISLDGCVRGFDPSPFEKAGDLRFRFNAENIAALVALMGGLGISEEEALSALGDFEFPPYRMERVGEKKGRVFYNDSKATNPHAVSRALRFLDAPVVLIMGGLNKGMDFSCLREEVASKVRSLVLYGEAARQIERDLGYVVPCTVVDLFEDAVRTAWKLSRPGDIVLLSPGCASFDQFSSYIERGEAFNRIVGELE